MRLFLGHRAVLCPSRNNEQLTGAKRDIPLAHANGNATLEHVEEVVRVVVLVPDELTLDLHDHQIVAIELTHYARLPVTFEGSELLCEVDGAHGGWPR